MIPYQEALHRLHEGNLRFVECVRNGYVKSRAHLNKLPVAGQRPFAIVLGCSDSRVPAEIVFDQGLGDLFVIRVAGNIVAPSQIGSVEFAVENFGTRLVVVLGHSQCGAVQATLKDLEQPVESRSTHLNAILGRIRPSLAPLLESDLKCDRGALISKAVQRNVQAAVKDLQVGSDFLMYEIGRGNLKIVSAVYSVETGAVEFQ